MPSYFLNPTVFMFPFFIPFFLASDLFTFGIIFLSFLIIWFIESIVVILYFRKLTEIQISPKWVFKAIFVSNMLTSLLGGFFFWFVPSSNQLLITLILCFIFSVFFEQLVVSRLFRSDFPLYSKHNISNAIVVSNIVSYLITAQYLQPFYVTYNETKLINYSFSLEFFTGIAIMLLGVVLWKKIFYSTISTRTAFAMFPIFMFLIILFRGLTLILLLIFEFFELQDLFNTPNILLDLLLFSLISYLLTRFLNTEKLEHIYEDLTYFKFLKFLGIIKPDNYDLTKIKRTLYVPIVIIFFAFLPIINAGLPISVNNYDNSDSLSTINFYLPYRIETLDPRQANDYTTTFYSAKIISNNIFGYLGYINPNSSEVLPYIAENWTRNADGSYTFTIREDAIFHDGTPVRAQDVKYSWRLGLILLGLVDSFYDTRFDDYFNFTYSSSISRTFTVSSNIFTLDPYFFPLAFSGRNPYLALFPRDTTIKSLILDPISCGPYKIRQENRQYSITQLERFEYFVNIFNGTFKIDNSSRYIDFQPYDPTNQYRTDYLFENLDEGGNTHIILVEEEYNGNFTNLQTISKTGYVDLFGQSISKQMFLAFNMLGNHPKVFNGTGNYPLTETWFREVVALSINYTDFRTNSSLGISNSSFKFDFWDSFIEQNLTRASEILQENGYTALGFSNEPDNRFGYGMFLNETLGKTTGHHFTISVLSDEENRIANQLSKNLKKIGIYLDIIDETNNDFRFCTPGLEYNASYTNEPDPEFQAPHSDFCFTNRYYTSDSIIDYLDDFSWNNWWKLGRWDLNGGWYSDIYETNVSSLYPFFWSQNTTLVSGLQSIITSSIPQVPLSSKNILVGYNKHLRGFFINSFLECCPAFWSWV